MESINFSMYYYRKFLLLFGGNQRWLDYSIIKSYPYGYITELPWLLRLRFWWWTTYQHLSTFWSNTQRLMWSIQLFHWIPQNQLSLIFIPTWTSRDQNLPAPLTPKILPSNRPAAIRALWILSESKTWLTIFLLSAINHEYRDQISGFTPVVSKSAVAAYLTIEFKKDEHTEERERENQTPS